MPDGPAAGWEALVVLSAAIGSRNRDAITTAMDRAAIEATADSVEEILLQSHLFVGFPDALNAMILWRERSGKTAPAERSEDADLWESRGSEVCERVYGANYTKLRANVSALHPDLEHWMVTGGYGRVIGRPALDLLTRELCIAALLAVWDTPRQLHSHLRGALNAGASTRVVDRTMELATATLDPPAARRVHDLWTAIRPPS